MNKFRIITEEAESAVAVIAQHAANLAALVVVVDRHQARHSPMKGLLGLAADRARMPLSFKKGFVFLGREAVLLTEAVLQRVVAVFGVILLAPSCGYFSRAVFAYGLEAAAGARRLVEVGDASDPLAATAPFLAKSDRRAASEAAVVAYDVGQRLALNSTDFRPVPSSQWRLLTAPALAIATRDCFKRQLSALHSDLHPSVHHAWQGV